MLEEAIFFSFVIVKAKFYDGFIETTVGLDRTASAQFFLQPFCFLQHYFLFRIVPFLIFQSHRSQPISIASEPHFLIFFGIYFVQAFSDSIYDISLKQAIVTVLFKAAQ